jgi:hypothetical protein
VSVKPRYKSSSPSYFKEWRQKRNAAGMCQRCPNPALNGRTRCRPCSNQEKLNGKAHPATMKDVLIEDHPKVKAALDNPIKVCALCKSTTHNGKGWHIDHCHVTHRFRGLLCQNCNVGLGHFKDSQELLLKAIAYLGNTDNE